MIRTKCATFALSLSLLLTARIAAQQTYPTTAPADEPGYESIFDGKTLAGWEGDPKYWRAENGALVGEITPENRITRNTFIIWRGGTLKDFELKLDFRITAGGNSGINYRSAELPDPKLAMKGYQFDFDGANRYSGNNYEERGRTFMATRGQIVRAVDGGKRETIGSLGDPAELAKLFKKEDWNQAHIIARGGTIVHILNGQVMCVLIDDDTKNRALEGSLGVQVHTGPAMKVEYRKIVLKKIEPPK